MTDTEKEYVLRKQIKKLAGFKGSGTELISVYIPAGSPVHEMGGKLREEMSQASNIKSKSTKTNVLGALERIMGHLKLFRHAPDNGLAVFCGNVSDNPAKVEFELISIEPPVPLKVGIYRCDSRFFLEPLEGMMESKDTYGIVVMDGREATLAVVKGTHIDIVKRMHSTAHQKVSKGGQSQRRYQRLVEEQIEKYYKRIGEAMDDAFVNRAKAVIIGGPGPAKEGLLKLRPFNYQLKILGPVDTGYTEDYGVREVLEKSGDILAEQDAIKEKKLVDRFIKEIVSESGLATYGVKEVSEAIRTKQADTVLLSEGLPYAAGRYACNTCNAEERKLSREKPAEKADCRACGRKDGMRLIEDMPLIDELTELARANSIKVEIVSTDTTEGAQFLHGFAGIGAFLKYRTR